MLVSIITALYNEEESVLQLLENYRRLFSLKPPDIALEFVFVNDGSKDKTIQILTANLPQELKSTTFSHPVNKGFGAAMRTGIGLASGKIIVCYDADSTYPVEDIFKLIKLVQNGWDVASANPFGESVKLEKVPVWRQVLTKGNALLYRIALGKGASKISVFSCAFRAYKSSVIKPVSFKSNGFGAASEVLGRLLIKKYSVIEVPSQLSTRQFGYSKMNVRKATIEHLKNVGMFFKIRFFNY
jgi:dolichol-phosphate mannosyltransferase